MKKFTLALALVGMLMLALGSATVAASPSDKGATTLNIDTCAPLIGGGSFCIAVKGMINETVTPSGNVSFVTNYRQQFKVFNAAGELYWDETIKDHFHALTKDGVLQELSSRTTVILHSFGQTYCVTYHFHGANGQDQIVKIDFCD